MSLCSDGVLLRFEPRFGEVMQAAGYENAASGDMWIKQMSKYQVYWMEKYISLTQLRFFTNNVIYLWRVSAKETSLKHVSISYLEMVIGGWLTNADMKEFLIAASRNLLISPNYDLCSTV